MLSTTQDVHIKTILRNITLTKKLNYFDIMRKHYLFWILTFYIYTCTFSMLAFVSYFFCIFLFLIFSRCLLIFMFCFSFLLGNFFSVKKRGLRSFF